MADKHLDPVSDVVLHAAYSNDDVGSFSSDCKEPPPSYQDAVSDYEYSPIQPSDALPEDDRQSVRGYAQYRGDQKSSTINVASDESRRRSEEREGVLGTHQEIPSVFLRHVRMQTNISVGLRESVGLQRLTANVFSTSIPE